MAILDSTIAPSSAAFKANREGMEALIARMTACGARPRSFRRRQGALRQARPVAAARTRRAAARSRRALLELSTLAGYRFDDDDAEKACPAAASIAGIGMVSGVR